jgi:acetate kinase
MRTLVARQAAGDAAADLAVTTYVRRIRMQVGAYAALLGGLDTLVFTGGIGEHATEIRNAIVAGLGHLDAVDVRVIAADEERMIAAATEAALTPT